MCLLLGDDERFSDSLLKPSEKSSAEIVSRTGDEPSSPMGNAFHDCKLELSHVGRDL
jgi:hypothetical protein